MRLILTTDTVGGVWTFTQELATELLLRGHEIHLVSFGRSPSVEQLGLATHLQHSHPGRFRYTPSEAPLEWMQNNQAAFEVGASLLQAVGRKFRPDAYLFSQFCYGALPVTSAKIVVAHSDVLSWGEACGETLDENGAWMRTYRELVHRGLSHADAVVSPTAAYLCNLRTHFADLPCTQRVIANGRNIAETFRQNRLLQGVTAGRMWDRAKNLRLLLERTLPLPLVIAGECHDGVRDSTDDVLCIGPQSQTQLFDLFEQSAVYLCTSLYEPFGLAPLEAALCGCAVLAMDLPSLREVWGSAALYFHDADSLSHLLIRLRDNPELLAQAQARSVARATTYTTSRMADQYLELLLTLTTNQHEVNAHAA